MAHRLAELAELVGGRVEGDPDRDGRGGPAAGRRRSPRPLVPAPRALPRAGRAARAGALCSVGASRRPAISGPRPLLIVDDPDLRARPPARRVPRRPRRPEPGVHPTAVLEPGCEVDPAAHVGPYAVIGAGSRIGAGAAIHRPVGRRRGCRWGRARVLHPHAVLYDRHRGRAGVRGPRRRGAGSRRLRLRHARRRPPQGAAGRARW